MTPCREVVKEGFFFLFTFSLLFENKDKTLDENILLHHTPRILLSVWLNKLDSNLRTKWDSNSWYLSTPYFKYGAFNHSATCPLDTILLYMLRIVAYFRPLFERDGIEPPTALANSFTASLLTIRISLMLCSRRGLNTNIRYFTPMLSPFELPEPNARA